MTILKTLNTLNCKKLQCYCTLPRVMNTNAMSISFFLGEPPKKIIGRNYLTFGSLQKERNLQKYTRNERSYHVSALHFLPLDTLFGKQFNWPRDG